MKRIWPRKLSLPLRKLSMLKPNAMGWIFPETRKGLVAVSPGNLDSSRTGGQRERRYFESGSFSLRMVL